MRPDKDAPKLYRLWIHADAERGGGRDASKLDPRLVWILQINELAILPRVARVRFVRHLELLEELADLRKLRLGADADGKAMFVILVPRRSRLLDLGKPIVLAHLRRFGIVEEPRRALEMRRSRVRQVGTDGAAHASKQEVGKVDPRRQLLRLVHFEQQVGVAHDNTRRVAAQLAEGVDGVERGHRRTTDQATDGARLVD